MRRNTASSARVALHSRSCVVAPTHPHSGGETSSSAALEVLGRDLVEELPELLDDFFGVFDLLFELDAVGRRGVRLEAKMGASVRTARAIASEGRESRRISCPPVSSSMTA